MKEQNSIKAAFFDIDGTLYDHQTHQIPDKHQRMLELLHQKASKSASVQDARFLFLKI